MVVAWVGGRFLMNWSGGWLMVNWSGGRKRSFWCHSQMRLDALCRIRLL